MMAISYSLTNEQVRMEHENYINILQNNILS